MGRRILVLYWVWPNTINLRREPVPIGPIRAIYFYPALKLGIGNDEYKGSSYLRELAGELYKVYQSFGGKSE